MKFPACVFQRDMTSLLWFHDKKGQQVGHKSYHIQDMGMQNVQNILILILNVIQL